VAVCWRSQGRDDLSAVRNLSVGGLFIETATPRPVGTTTKIDFLVQEGQIRADATVRHLKPATGMGLQFTVLPDADRARLGMLITRLRRQNQ
jgi:PilZ domain-containing protein